MLNCEHQFIPVGVSTSPNPVVNGDLKQSKLMCVCTLCGFHQVRVNEKLEEKRMREAKKKAAREEKKQR